MVAWSGVGTTHLNGGSAKMKHFLVRREELGQNPSKFRPNEILGALANGGKNWHNVPWMCVPQLQRQPDRDLATASK